MNASPTGELSENLTIEVDGVRFVTGFAAPSTELLTLVKTPDMVERYRTLLQRFERPRIMELGIAFGGSVALLTLLADPERFLAIDLGPERSPLLSQLLDERELHDRVQTRHGVDQADPGRLLALTDEFFGDGPLDLIIDDASHLYHESKVSFETLFPLLRPGGLYVIEDWKWSHEVVNGMYAALADPASEWHHVAAAVAAAGDEPPPQEIPLSRLALELVLARADTADDLFTKVSVDKHWIVVERGPGSIDPRTFSLDGLVLDRTRQLR